MTRKLAAIAYFERMLSKLRSTQPDTAEWVAAESNVNDARWLLHSVGLSDAEIADIARGRAQAPVDASLRSA